VLPYAAYLRVYEPLNAFPEPERSRWAGYAPSAQRPERVSALEAEHEEAMRRLIAVLPIVAEFHSRALVELDYGGLAHLPDDGALRAGPSVAEVAAAIIGLETGELDLAATMCHRLRKRWWALRAAETAS
jgi:hypothetical protein